MKTLILLLLLTVSLYLYIYFITCTQHLKPVGGYRYKSPPIASPPAKKSPSPSPLSPGRYSPSTNRLPPSSSGSGSPLPPANSPNGSIQHVRSGPHIDPPSDFAVNHGGPSPRSLSPNLRLSSNGGIPHQQTDNRFYSQERRIVSQGSPNSNGNNNQSGAPRNRFPNQSISLGMVDRVMGRNDAEQNAANLQQYQFPSQASTLSHPESRSSRESGFDADSELENPWYNSQSPNTSPQRPLGHSNRPPVLGPQVTLPSTHINSRHTRTESRDSYHSGSQMSQHESLSDDYERLTFNSQAHSQSSRASTLAERRRGSLDAVVMLSAKEKSSTYTYGEQQVEYDQAYPPPSHKPSRSYDATGHRGPRGLVRHTPPSSHHSQESQPSPRPPLPPSSRPSSRASSARSRSEKRSHVRNHSQPDHLSSMPASYYHTSTHSNSQPDSQSPGQFYPHREKRSSTKSNDSVFQSAYPRHKGAQIMDQRTTKSHHTRDPRMHNVHKTTRGRFYSDMHSRIVENEPYNHNPSHHHSERLKSFPNYPSDESNSRQSTPVATPTLVTKVCY